MKKRTVALLLVSALTAALMLSACRSTAGGTGSDAGENGEAAENTEAQDEEDTEDIEENEPAELLRLAGAYISDDEQTVVNYTLSFYTDASCLMECHENKEGSWKENEDHTLTATIGGRDYVVNKETVEDKDVYAMEYEDSLGSVEYTVEMKSGDRQTNTAEIDAAMIEAYKDAIDGLLEQYADRPEGEIIFYGGSNFVKWTTLEEDLAGYDIQNVSFGGSNDAMRHYYIQELVYDKKPSVVFYMSSTNDWTKGASVAEVIEGKQELFDEMAEKCPDTIFVIMSATPNPLRYYGEYHAKMIECDQWTRQYCEEHDNFEFMNVVPGLSKNDGKEANTEIWQEDNLHLNEQGYALLTEIVKDELKKLGM